MVTQKATGGQYVNLRELQFSDLNKTGATTYNNSWEVPPTLSNIHGLEEDATYLGTTTSIFYPSLQYSSIQQNSRMNDSKNNYSSPPKEVNNKI